MCVCMSVCIMYWYYFILGMHESMYSMYICLYVKSYAFVIIFVTNFNIQYYNY